jgi:hypothetical protein
MIKVFTTGDSPLHAGDSLTRMFNEWLKTNPFIKILHIHTNSNKFGWMLTVHYEEIHSEAD